MLEDKGYTVLTACDGPSGIDMARRNPIDAVVLDFKMPGMTGDEVAEILKRDRPEVPIILLTGVEWGLPETLLRMIDSYVGKGEGSAALFTAIERALKHRRRKPITRAAPDRSRSA